MDLVNIYGRMVIFMKDSLEIIIFIMVAVSF